VQYMFCGPNILRHYSEPLAKRRDFCSGHSATYRSIHVMSVLGPIADYFVANWQRRFSLCATE
jgi:hypothetical protein